uniref:Uncharacterized protein n=1 Tax=Rangifer tarandus platyrhynchus TaxID=3082113 RepID=A0ACB0F147_RANTA|nr:unnamed protein product [Rangifer tarandus platyrhynchus]
MDRRQEGANAEFSFSRKARGGSSSEPPFADPLSRPSSPDPQGSPPWLRPLWPPVGTGAAHGQSVPGASPTPRAGPAHCGPAGAEDRPAVSLCAAAEAELLCAASCHRGSALRPPRRTGLAPRRSRSVSGDDSSFRGSPWAAAAGLLTREAASAGRWAPLLPSLTPQSSAQGSVKGGTCSLLLREAGAERPASVPHAVSLTP